MSDLRAAGEDAAEIRAGAQPDEAPEIRAGAQPDEPPEIRAKVQPDEAPKSGVTAGAGDENGGQPIERPKPEAWPVEPPARPLNLMNPVVLAYVGDAVFELLVRQHLAARPNHKPDELHRGAVRYVSAKAQRALLEKLQPRLTEEEAEIVRRGRNAKSGSPPKGADMSDYRHATALECLFGWLYYAGRFDRMAELLRMADDEPRADGGSQSADHRKEGDR